MELIINNEKECPFKYFIDHGFVYDVFGCCLTGKQCNGINEKYDCPLAKNKIITIKLGK